MDIQRIHPLVTTMETLQLLDYWKINWKIERQKRNFSKINKLLWMQKKNIHLYQNHLKVLKLLPLEIVRAVISKIKGLPFVYYFPYFSWFPFLFVVESCFILNQVFCLYLICLTIYSLFYKIKLEPEYLYFLKWCTIPWIKYFVSLFICNDHLS